MQKARTVFRIFALVVAQFLILWAMLYAFLQAAYPMRYRGIVERYASEFDVESGLIYSIMKNESGFSEKAVSDKNAVGLMQITPSTAEWISEKINETDYCLSDPDVNIRFSCWYISYLCKTFGSVETAVAAYNAGEGNVKKWLNDGRYSFDGKSLSVIPFGETEKYVKNVMSSYKIYNKLY